MPFGLRRRAGAPGKLSLARTLWRSLESLPSREQIDRLISREVARAERNGLHFSLVLFRVRKGGRLGLAERRMAITLLRRVRLTDEVGWFDDDHLCALLPDTSAAGARIFADAVCDLVARKGPRPISTIYSYPFDWIEPGDEGGTGGSARRDDDRRDGDHRGGRHEPADVRGSRRSTDRLGLGDLVGEDTATGHATPHSSGPRHRVGDSGPLGRGEQAVAVLEAPPARAMTTRESAAAPTIAPVASARALAAADADDADPQIKHLHELLVRPMPLWKRTLDVVGAATILTLASPILAAAAVAIRLSSTGPAIFKQRRAGLGGKPFTIYKFRTMCNDAEARKKALRKFSEQDGPAFKMERDPRVTRVGAFLRKTSIDELPQLFNVLKGDMSLVGPRPLPIDEQDAAETWQQRRLDVTPGLTCIWQIEGRSKVTFAEWVRMDVAYMRRRTVFHDLAILFKTVPAVLLRRGAK